MGYIPEQWLHTRGTPRTFFLVGVAAVLAGVSLGAAFATLPSLYFISLCMGLTFGAHWSLLPAITSDIFGLLHFAANYTTLQVRELGWLATLCHTLLSTIPRCK
jgi:MFS family permease